MLTVATSTATPRAQSLRWRSATPAATAATPSARWAQPHFEPSEPRKYPFAVVKSPSLKIAANPCTRWKTPTTMSSTAANEVDATRRWESYVFVGIPRESTFLDMGPSFRGTPAPGASGCRGTTVLPAPPAPRHPYRMTVGAVAPREYRGRDGPRPSPHARGGPHEGRRVRPLRPARGAPPGAPRAADPEARPGARRGGRDLGEPLRLGGPGRLPRLRPLRRPAPPGPARARLGHRRPGRGRRLRVSRPSGPATRSTATTWASRAVSPSTPSRRESVLAPKPAALELRSRRRRSPRRARSPCRGPPAPGPARGCS